jgi:hypothetical protein
VKCDDLHSTQDCTKPRSAPPKCINCGGDHPANHGGCPIYIKHMEAKTRRLPRPVTRPPPSPTPLTLSSSKVTSISARTASYVGPSRCHDCLPARYFHTSLHVRVFQIDYLNPTITQDRGRTENTGYTAESGKYSDG